MNQFRRSMLICALAMAIAPSLCFGAGDLPIIVRAMPGFRLLDPSYRANGTGMTAAVSLCRVVGWAASSPGMLHFQRAGGGGMPDEHHDVYVSRLGLRGGENCERVATHFDAAPRATERIIICLAYSHHRCE